MRKAWAAVLAVMLVLALVGCPAPDNGSGSPAAVWDSAVWDQASWQ